MDGALSIRLHKGAVEIRTLDDWSRFAPPKSRKHWQPGRSAMECARAWCGAKGVMLPAEILMLLESDPVTLGVTLSHGEPEKKIVFDRAGGEPRNADVAILGTDSSGKIVAITIEAKADESFGGTFEQTIAKSMEQIVSGKRSNGVGRAEQLACALLPPRRFGKEVSRAEATPSLGTLRYQLLTAVAGTLAFAHQSGAHIAVFVVHEFVTDQTEDINHEANARDLNAFVTRLSDGAIREITPGELVGPIPVAKNANWPSGPVLYIGKARRDIRTR
jgi:hypothetical protein